MVTLPTITRRALLGGLLALLAGATPIAAEAARKHKPRRKRGRGPWHVDKYGCGGRGGPGGPRNEYGKCPSWREVS